MPAKRTTKAKALPAAEKSERDSTLEEYVAEKTFARDATLARLLEARHHLAVAIDGLDECVSHFVDTDEDGQGKERAELLEAIDEELGEAAHLVQIAQGTFAHIDPTQGAPT